MENRLVRALRVGMVGLAVLLGVAGRANAQAPTIIKGRVINDAGAPLAGASVFIDALRAGAQTDNTGHYTVTVAGNNRGRAELTVRRIGYKKTIVAITLSGGALTQDFTLETQALQLTGVIVSALSIQREKSTVGTSQQQISNAELTRTQTPSLINTMSGKISGVSITGNGNVGGSARIVIRGQGSITGDNQPLFIVDGVPVSNAGFSTASASGGRDYGTAISDINPDDIASMTVLKGPNAAALYGSRAANGAVVITTKSGVSAGEGTKVTLTARMTTDDMSIFPKYQNQYGQGFGGEFSYVDGAGSGVNDGADESWGPKLDGRLIDQFNGKQLPWVAHPDNVKNYFRKGSTMSNTVSLVHATTHANLRMSLTKENVMGIVPNSGLAKLVGAVSGQVDVTDKFSVGAGMQWTQNQGFNRPENGYTEGNPFMTFTWFGRQVDVAALKNKWYNVAGNPYGMAVGSLYNWNDNYHRNPWWQQAMNPAFDNRDHFVGQLNANYKFNSWLSGLVRLGSDNYRMRTEEDFAKGNIDRASASYNGGFNVGDSRANESTLEGILTARKAFGKLELTGNAGGTVRRNDSYRVGYSTSGILVEGLYNLSNAGITPTVTNAEFHSGVNSAYGSAVATWDQWWTVEVTGRNDWSSTLPKENASYFYPSFSTSVVLTNLFPSLTSGGILTYAKLRGGSAQVGADAGPYQLQTLYNGSSNKFGGAALYSYSNVRANPTLKPERVTGTEAGVELSLFNDLVTLDASYYTKVSKDQIINLTVAPASGFTSAAVNAGQMTNKGIEAQVTAKPLDMKNGLTWKTSINYTKNTNNVDALAPGLTTLVIASQWGANIEARVGQPYGVLYGYGWARDATTHELLTSGGFPYRASSKSILGNVNPDWIGGWLNEFSYKQFSLSALIDVRHGGQNFSVGNWWGMYGGILASTLKGREIDWDKPGLTVKGKDVDTGLPNVIKITAEDYGHNIYPVHEDAILPTGFIKLREVRFGWEAPKNITSRMHLSRLNAAIVGRNLWTKTDFPNYDPENSTNAGNGGQGFDMGAMPTTRTFGFNLSITP